MKNIISNKKFKKELIKNIYKRLDKKEVDEIFYVENIINSIFIKLKTNEELLKLSEEFNNGYVFLILQINKNKSVDFNQLFRSLFRSYHQHIRLSEKGDTENSSILILSSLTILNEIINRLYKGRIMIF